MQMRFRNYLFLITLTCVAGLVFFNHGFAGCQCNAAEKIKYRNPKLGIKFDFLECALFSLKTQGEELLKFGSVSPSDVIVLEAAPSPFPGMRKITPNNILRLQQRLSGGVKKHFLIQKVDFQNIRIKKNLYLEARFQVDKIWKGEKQTIFYRCWFFIHRNHIFTITAHSKDKDYIRYLWDESKYFISEAQWS